MRNQKTIRQNKWAQLLPIVMCNQVHTVLPKWTFITLTLLELFKMFNNDHHGMFQFISKPKHSATEKRAGPIS